MMKNNPSFSLNKILPPDGVLIGLAGLLLLLSLGMVFFYAPQETTMGAVQRIFYYHVASAWVGFFAFFITFAGSVLYLLYSADRWDILAKSSAEIGFVFISMTLVTGMLWARPVWGVFWTWEPRLTISAVQWLLYFAYSVLRNSIRGSSEARLAAVFGVIAFLTVPLSWFAIRIWRTIHPTVFMGSSEGLPQKMLLTLLVSLFTFTFIYLTFLVQRIRLERAARDRSETWE